MAQFSNVDQPLASATVTAPTHVSEALTWGRFSWESPSYWNVQIPAWTIKPLLSTSITAHTNPAGYK